MKKILFLILAMFMTMGASAQEEREYVPFVGEGKTWYCGYAHPFERFPATPEDPLGNGIDCIFTMRGDSLIGDKEYKRVYCQFEEYYGDAEQHYYGAVREEACQVFIIEEGTTEEKLIYDFSRPNEVIKLNFNDYPFARTEGWGYYAFLPGQLEYSVCKFTDNGEVDYTHDSSSWIDGVGCPYNNPFAFELRFLPFDEPKFGKDLTVFTSMKDGEYIFNIEWLASPINPTSIGSVPPTGNSPKTSVLYDLSGRRVVNPKRGLYIQGGKRVLVKQ